MEKEACVRDVRFSLDHGWTQLAQGGPLATPGTCSTTPGRYRQRPPQPTGGGACVTSASLSDQAAYHTDDRTRLRRAGEGDQGWTDQTEIGVAFSLGCIALTEGRIVTASDICRGPRAGHRAVCHCGLLESG